MKNNKKYNYSVVLYAVLLILAFLIQKTNILFDYNSPAPSLILSIVLVVSFFENYWFCAMFGLVCGILVDTTSVHGFGQYALLYLLTGFVCSLLLEWLFQNNFASFAIVALPAIIIHQFIEILISSGFSNGIFKLFFKFYPLVIIYTYLTSFVIYTFFYFVIKRNDRFKKPSGIIKK